MGTFREVQLLRTAAILFVNLFCSLFWTAAIRSFDGGKFECECWVDSCRYCDQDLRRVYLCRRCERLVRSSVRFYLRNEAKYGAMRCIQAKVIARRVLMTTTVTVEAKLVFSDERKFVGSKCFEVMRADSNEVRLVAQGQQLCSFVVEVDGFGRCKSRSVISGWREVSLERRGWSSSTTSAWISDNCWKWSRAGRYFNGTLYDVLSPICEKAVWQFAFAEEETVEKIRSAVQWSSITNCTIHFREVVKDKRVCGFCDVTRDQDSKRLM